MANNKSAEKRIRQDEKRRMRNKSHRTRMRNVVKTVRQATSQGEGDKASELLAPAIKTIDSAATKGVLHRNAAARLKSRLTRAVVAAKAAQAPPA